VSRLLSLIPLALAVSFAACASTGTSSGTRRAPDLIAGDEIASSGAANALEAVTRLRPNWMRARGTGSIAGGRIQSQVIVVYLDGQRLGDITSLRMLSVVGIQSMQWLDAARAATVLSGLGSEAIAGAIVIKTVR
jgi:hypothetical protein